MKKPLRMAALATVAVLPLVMLAPLPADAAAPAATETVSLKLSGCTATVTGKWSREPTAPTSVTLSLEVQQNSSGGWVTDSQTSAKSSFGTSGSYKSTFPTGAYLTSTTGLRPIRAALILNGSPVVYSDIQQAYCEYVAF